MRSFIGAAGYHLSLIMSMNTPACNSFDIYPFPEKCPKIVLNGFHCIHYNETG